MNAAIVLIEQVIKWDLTRTFPAHDFFKDPDGEGQRRLYNICRVPPPTPLLILCDYHACY